MKSIRFSVRWDGVVVPLALLATIAASAPAASISAGSVLTTQPQMTYQVNGVRGSAVSSPVSLTVDKAPLARVSLETRSVVVNGVEAIACTITNAGNYTGDFRIVVTESANTSAVMVDDTNGDGMWQRTESTRSAKVTDLKPDATRTCFLVIRPRANAAAGDRGNATVYVAPLDNVELEVSVNVSITYGDVAVHPAFIFESGDPLNSSPTVRDGLALVGSDGGVVYAVTATGKYAGTLAWRYPASEGLGAPIRGRVAVDASGYYFTANNGRAYHLDKKGAEVWATQVVSEGVTMEAMPLVDADTVTLACGDGRVRRLDKRTGAFLGQSQQIGGGNLTTPSAPRPGELWLGAADGNLYSVNDAQGFTVLSTYNVSMTGVLATPYVDVASGLVLSVTPEGNVFAMRVRSSQMAWGPVALGAPVHGAPWVDSSAGVVYFAGADGMLYALSVKDGKPVGGYPARMTDDGGFQNTPVVAPMPVGSPVVFLASDNGRIIAAQTARPESRKIYKINVPKVGFIGSLALSGISAGDVLVAGASNGALYGFSIGDLTP